LAPATVAVPAFNFNCPVFNDLAWVTIGMNIAHKLDGYSEMGQSLSGPTVLLFSKDEAEGAILQELLGRHVDLTRAGDSLALLGQLQQRSYDAVVWSSPFRAGEWERTLHRLRALYPHLPVIILSTAPERHAWARLAEMATFDLLTAPLEEEQLRRAIEPALQCASEACCA
jgi:DNA-binding NtrC family response regulator